MLDAGAESDGTAVAEDTHLGVRIATPALIAGLALETGAHVLGKWDLAASVALASLILVLPIALLWHWRPVPVARAHEAIAFLIAVVIANNVAHVAVGNIAGPEFFRASAW